jgi:hypothetical protein
MSCESCILSDYNRWLSKVCEPYQKCIKTNVKWILYSIYHHLKIKNGTEKKNTIHLTFVEIKKDEMGVHTQWKPHGNTILKWVLEKQILLMWLPLGREQ